MGTAILSNRRCLGSSRVCSRTAGAWSPVFKNSTGFASKGQLAGTRKLRSFEKREDPFGNKGHADTFDGQDSGDTFNTGSNTPSIGWVNNTDGGRSVLFPDYKQA